MHKYFRTKRQFDLAVPEGRVLGLALLLLILLITGCTTLPPEKREGIRAELNDRAERSLREFVEKFPEAEQELREAPGYLIGWAEAGMAGVVRGLGGQAVLIDTATGSRTYLNIGKIGVGVGMGAAEFEQLVILNDRETVERFQRGHWRVETAKWFTSGSDSKVVLPKGETLSRYVIARKGASATASTGILRVSVNKELTDDGVSDLSIPNIGFTERGEQTGGAPRIWRYRLPFLAQKVVDLGYELPIPYGAGVSGVSIKQDINIENLEVAFNGGTKSPYEFVSFNDTKTDIQSVQVKFDTWVLPFLNIFGMMGKVSGEATSDVLLDGNTLLGQLGADCNRLIPPLECILFRDKDFLLPIRADVETQTYGFGAVLAGGWKGWIGVLPFNVSYARGSRSVTYGRSVTITPRIGRLFNLKDKGNLAVFVGGNHFDSDLSIDGIFDVPNSDLEINYLIDQQNVDPWNLVVGFNWEFSRHISLALEYNGFIGSREAWISSLNFRLF